MTKSLGVIGGLGPAATAYFYELISRMTDASIDQVILMLILSADHLYRIGRITF